MAGRGFTSVSGESQGMAFVVSVSAASALGPPHISDLLPRGQDSPKLKVQRAGGSE